MNTNDTKLIKYPRTPHLPWTEGVGSDDRMLDSVEHFCGQRVIVTEKMDGENTSLYRNDSHARSLDGRHHPSRSWVKQFWSQICADIPDGWRVCGENLYAKHSIQYTKLPTFFMGFSMWNALNECLAWDDTVEWFSLLGIEPVPVLYDGTFDEAAIRALWTPENSQSTEGYVIRLADAFKYADFSNKVAKFVRKGHVQTVPHWMYGQPLVLNQLETK